MKIFQKLLLVVVGAALYSCKSAPKKSETKQVVLDTIKGVVSQQSNNNNIDNSSSDNDRDTSSQPLMSKLIFPYFSIKVNNCAFYGYKDDNNKFIYSGDSTTVKTDTKNYKMWTLTTKNDTVQLSTDDDRGLDVGTLEIVPSNKTDKFEIYYSFKMQIVAENGKDGVLWETMVPYKKIKDSLNYFFNAPEHNDIYSEMGLKIKEIKKKLNLKDKAFKKEAANTDYGTYTEHGVIFKNQLCEIPYNPIIYLKIDRFSENNLRETKYLVIDFSIPE